MKKLFLIVVFLLVGQKAMILYAQDISVLSCQKVLSDSTCLVAPRYDINDNACAIVKVFAKNISGPLDFKGNIVGQVITDEKVYTIYVLDKTKRLKLLHTDYYPKVIDFTEYEESKNGLEGNCVYYVSISGTDNSNSVKANNTSGTRILSFTSDAPLRQLFVNGLEWKITNNSSQRLLSYGIYEYDAVTDNNVHKKGKVELSPSIGSKVVKISFNDL